MAPPYRGLIPGSMGYVALFVIYGVLFSLPVLALPGVKEEKLLHRKVASR
jgi:hypothetical protein